MNKGLQKVLFACIISIAIFILISVYLVNEPGSTSESKDDFTLVIAVMSTPFNIKRRNEIRETYIQQYKEIYCSYCKDNRTDPKVRLYFFIGYFRDVKNDSIREEQKQYDDLIYLGNMKENMDRGKSLEVMKWLYRNTRSTFAMKADDDSFINVPNLLKRLENIKKDYPKRDRNIYYGYPLIEDPTKDGVQDIFMGGMGYILSRNLVEFLGSMSTAFTAGAEDQVIATHIHRYILYDKNSWSSKRIVLIGDRVHFHDYPQFKGPASWELNCQDIVIHQLKSSALLQKTNEFYSQCCIFGENKKFDEDLSTDVPEVCSSPPASDTTCNNGKSRGIACYEPRQFKITDKRYTYIDDSIMKRNA